MGAAPSPPECVMLGPRKCPEWGWVPPCCLEPHLGACGLSLRTRGASPSWMALGSGWARAARPPASPRSWARSFRILSGQPGKDPSAQAWPQWCEASGQTPLPFRCPQSPPFQPRGARRSVGGHVCPEKWNPRVTTSLGGEWLSPAGLRSIRGPLAGAGGRELQPSPAAGWRCAYPTPGSAQGFPHQLSPKQLGSRVHSLLWGRLCGLYWCAG